MFVYKLWTVESQCAMSITKVFALGTARLIIQGRAGMTFGHSGTGMVNSIPQIREREGNGKNTFPKFGNGKGVRNSHSHNSGMGREWKKNIPIIREREENEKKTFPKFGNGKGMTKSIPIIREWESEAFILGNGREREFPLTP